MSLMKINPCSMQYKEWVSIFRQGSVSTKTQSLSFVKKLTALAVSTITFNRGVFASSQYDDFTLDGRPVKLLRGNHESKRAFLFTTRLTSAFQAIDKQYMRELILEISTADGKMIEFYKLAYSYENGSASVSLSQETTRKLRSSNRLNSYRLEDVQDNTAKMFLSIGRFTQNLKSLPEKYIIQLRISYYDEVTPTKYQPKFFSAAERKILDKLLKTEGVGGIQTKFHSVTLQSGSLLKSDPSCQETIRTKLSTRTQLVPMRKVVYNKSSSFKACDSSTPSTTVPILSKKEKDVYAMDFSSDSEPVTKFGQTKNKRNMNEAQVMKNTHEIIVPSKAKTNMSVKYDEIIVHSSEIIQLSDNEDDLAIVRGDSQNDSKQTNKGGELVAVSVELSIEKEIIEESHFIVPDVQQPCGNNVIVTASEESQDSQPDPMISECQLESGITNTKLSSLPSGNDGLNVDPFPTLLIQEEAENYLSNSHVYRNSKSPLSSPILDMTFDPAAVDEEWESSEEEVMDEDIDPAVTLIHSRPAVRIDLTNSSTCPPSPDSTSNNPPDPLVEVKKEKEDINQSQDSEPESPSSHNDCGKEKDRYSVSSPLGVSSLDINFDIVKEERITQDEEISQQLNRIKRQKLGSTPENPSQTTPSYSSFIHSTKDTLGTIDDSGNNAAFKCLCKSPSLSNDIVECYMCKTYHHAICYGYLFVPNLSFSGCCYQCSVDKDDPNLCWDPYLFDINGDLSLYAVYRQVLIRLWKHNIAGKRHVDTSSIVSWIEADELLANDFIEHLIQDGFIRPSLRKSDLFVIKRKNLFGIIDNTFKKA